MTDDEPGTPKVDAAEERPKPPRYEPPQIVWREPYEPLSFGSSCAKTQGQTPCYVGPISS
jgi:hypothetical protein